MNGAASLSSPAARPLSELLAAAEPLTLAERREVVYAAQILIEQLYVHLPLKRAMHAVDPVQRLRLLQHRLAGFTDRRFHDEMLGIFVALRDLHTNYLLPQPFAGQIATLPFRIEAYWEQDTRRYLVTSIAQGIDVPPFAVGVEVTHWSGSPIERAVALNGERNAGSNLDARHARGLASLTQRPMGRLAAPDEEWVDVTFLADQTAHEQRFVWQVIEPPPAPAMASASQVADPVESVLGLDALVEDIRRAQKLLFAPGAIALERSSADRGAPPDPTDDVSTLPDVLEFRKIAGPKTEFGYLRIRTFKVGPVFGFLDEVMRILALLPQEGLVIDVRGNGGGTIPAGELLLQLLTPRPIEPERLHFISSLLTLRFTRSNPVYEPWGPSIIESVETGATFSDGLPLTSQYTEMCNRVGQRYYGPVVVITDALCYSTTDIFAAGFQDHEIGPVLGTSANTGAGGANVWTYEELQQALPDDLGPLPRGASMRVAMRRTARVGRRAGDPLEDLGVVSDRIHQMTRRDLLESNVDLLATAAQVLAGMPSRSFAVELTDDPAGVGVSVSTAGIDRLDVVVDGRPRETRDVSDGQQALTVALDDAAIEHVVELRGFSKGRFVARRKLTLEPSAAPA